MCVLPRKMIRFMPFKKREVQRWLNDILYNVDLALQFTCDLDLQTFENDARTIYAVTRCLEIISEASRRLPEELKTRHINIPWRQMAGAGNIYRHDYEDVAAHYVWETVQLALPPLVVIVKEELNRLEML